MHVSPSDAAPPEMITSAFLCATVAILFSQLNTYILKTDAAV